MIDLLKMAERFEKLAHGSDNEDGLDPSLSHGQKKLRPRLLRCKELTFNLLPGLHPMQMRKVRELYGEAEILWGMDDCERADEALNKVEKYLEDRK